MTSVFDDPEKTKDDAETIERIKHFTDAIRHERTKKGVSQLGLMRETGIAQKTISEIEAGNNFKMSNYIKMSIALGLAPQIHFVRRKKGLKSKV